VIDSKNCLSSSEIDDLFLDGNPLDDPAWQEAERYAREADEGLRYRPKGYVACPLSWMRQVLPLVHSPHQMVVAQLVYTCSRTNSLNPIRNSELSKLGISRFAKYKAIASLEEAGLIEVDRRNGRTLSVRLLWMPPVSVSNTCRLT
jgi:hypothetical protein